MLEEVVRPGEVLEQRVLTALEAHHSIRGGARFDSGLTQGGGDTPPGMSRRRPLDAAHRPTTNAPAGATPAPEERSLCTTIRPT